MAFVNEWGYHRDLVEKSFRPALFYVCRSIRRDVLSVLYGSTVFRYDVKDYLESMTFWGYDRLVNKNVRHLYLKIRVPEGTIKWLTSFENVETIAFKRPLSGRMFAKQYYLQMRMIRDAGLLDKLRDDCKEKISKSLEEWERLREVEELGDKVLIFDRRPKREEPSSLKVSGSVITAHHGFL
ncbi:hypothetical protein EV356DRAFT_509091 [Viridothelium virens]|uniref:Uncharacterized protein n=1 Tax=Viridothelium virens TaxID=1048519 RepID=A0A6A6GXQ8_VIRVR|nr:hypothetical protein EV356DRAFT_509091 [Viridothelium virens]